MQTQYSLCAMSTHPYLRGEAGQVWLAYCGLVSKNGLKFHDEGEPIIELRNVHLVFDDFDPNDRIFKEHGDAVVIELYNKKMESTEIIPELNSSYGKRLYDQLGVDQVQWLVDRLKRKPETKAATISLLLPNDPGPRIPCLCIIDFKVRNNKLHLSGFFRSQNALRSYANFISIHNLHEKVAGLLGVELGEMTFLISSAHIYGNDMDKLKELPIV